MNVREVKFWYWLVDRLPKKVIYFCFMKVMVHSTSGSYSGTIIPELAGMDAVKRYGDDYGI